MIFSSTKHLKMLLCAMCAKNQVFISSQMKEWPLSSHLELIPDALDHLPPWPHNCLAPRPGLVSVVSAGVGGGDV